MATAQNGRTETLEPAGFALEENHSVAPLSEELRGLWLWNVYSDFIMFKESADRLRVENAVK